MQAWRARLWSVEEVGSCALAKCELCAHMHTVVQEGLQLPAVQGRAMCGTTVYKIRLSALKLQHCMQPRC